MRNERVELRRDPADAPAFLDLAGCDDRTAAGSGEPGHGFDLDAVLAGRVPSRPVVLLCHQPVMVDHAVRVGPTWLYVTRGVGFWLIGKAM